MLVVMHDGDVDAVLDAALDLETSRRADVFELDGRERRGDGHDGLDDGVGVLGVEQDGHARQAAERLHQGGLPLHDRHGRQRPDIAQAEHGRSVGDDGHEMADGGEAPGQSGVLLDLEADFGDAGRVDFAQDIEAVDRVAAADGDLPALVQLQDVIADFQKLHVRRGVGDGDQAVHVGQVVGEEDNVPQGMGRALVDHLDFADIAAGLADHG